MKVRIGLFLMLIMSGSGILAQKVDIDNFWIKLSYAKLPDNAVAENERTYSLKYTAVSEYDIPSIKDGIEIKGWKQLESDAAYDVAIRVNSFTYGTSKTNKRVEENKDKNGKLISSKTHYSMSNVDEGNGKMMIFGTKNSYSEYLKKMAKEAKDAEKMKKDKDKGKDKGKSKKEMEEEKKMKAIENNPFLKNVDVEVKEVEEENPKVVSSKPNIYDMSIGKSYTYQTQESTSSAAVSKEFNDNAKLAFERYREAYKSDVLSIINNTLNSLFGYAPVSENVKFKRLDSDEHPDFSLFDNAINATKLIFGKMRYNQSVEELKTDFQPILEYFNKTANKYEKSDDKHQKRLRAACYYNLAQIYYFLDMHDDAIAIGNKIVASDHDTKDGKKFIERSEKQKNQLEFFGMTSRHIDMKSGENEDDLGETVEGEGDDEK